MNEIQNQVDLTNVENITDPSIFEKNSKKSKYLTIYCLTSNCIAIPIWIGVLICFILFIIYGTITEVAYGYKNNHCIISGRSLYCLQDNGKELCEYPAKVITITPVLDDTIWTYQKYSLNQTLSCWLKNDVLTDTDMTSVFQTYLLITFLMFFFWLLPSLFLTFCCIIPSVKCLFDFRKSLNKN